MFEEIAVKIINFLEQFSGTRWSDPEINCMIILFILGFLIASIVFRKLKEKRDKNVL